MRTDEQTPTEQGVISDEADQANLAAGVVSGHGGGVHRCDNLGAGQRQQRKYDVSHLSGAQLAATEAQALEILKAEPRDRLVVVYCSVGYRSSALAEQLQARGFTNVYNLEGSIFEWANEGRPVYQTRSSAPSLAGSASKAQPEPQGERPVKLAHPYDAKWGAYLKRELWSPLP